MWNPFSSHIMQQVSLYVAVPLFLSTYDFQREKVLYSKFPPFYGLSVHKAEHSNFENAPNIVWQLR